MANTVACSIVGTQIDYCNSLFYGASEKYLDTLQRLQNKFARVVTNTCLRDHHSVYIPRELHWSPVRSRITFKLAILCPRALNDDQPIYLAFKIISYPPTRSLQPSDRKLLQEPQYSTKIGAHRFSRSAPRVWNSIPWTLRDIQTTSVFKTRLKHIYVRQHLHHVDNRAPDNHACS